MAEVTKQTPFTYLNYINSGDESDIDIDDKVYNQFLINRGLSMHLDTIAIANEINKYGCVDNQMHFDYLRHMVTPRKRWAKWPKPKEHPDASTIASYYGISMKKAYDLVGIITPEQIEQMKQEMVIDQCNKDNKNDS